MAATLMLAILVATPPMEAQQTPEGGLRPADLAAAGLELEPRIFESLGMSIHLPLGTVVQVERNEGQVVVNMQDAGTPPTWTMNIQRVRTDSSLETAANQVDGHLQTLARSGATALAHSPPLLLRRFLARAGGDSARSSSPVSLSSLRRGLSLPLGRATDDSVAEERRNENTR